MRAIDVIRRSGRNLRQSKIRTLLTASALAVGGFTLTLTLAAANGAQSYSQKIIAANFDQQSLVVAKDASLFGAQTSSEPREYSQDIGTAFGTTVKLLDDQDVATISRQPNVESVVRQYNLTAQYITREGAKKVVGAINVYDSGQKPELVAGQAEGRLRAGTVVLPDSYLKPLQFASANAALNQRISIQVAQLSGQSRAYNFTVVAVSTKSKLDIGFSAVGPYVAESDAASINTYINAGSTAANRVPTVIVRSDGADTTALKARLQGLGYEARTAQDLQSFLDQIIKVLQIIILVFGFITLVASFFGVVNTQYISVLERTREIGLMKALGMRRGTVSWLFIIEATWIGLLGALIGSIAAITAGTLLNPWISEQINFGDEQLLIFDPIQILALIAFLMLVTTVAGLLPARKASKLDPIEALRTE